MHVDRLSHDTAHGPWRAGHTFHTRKELFGCVSVQAYSRSLGEIAAHLFISIFHRVIVVVGPVTSSVVFLIENACLDCYECAVLNAFDSVNGRCLSSMTQWRGRNVQAFRVISPFHDSVSQPSHLRKLSSKLILCITFETAYGRWDPKSEIRVSSAASAVCRCHHQSERGTIIFENRNLKFLLFIFFGENSFACKRSNDRNSTVWCARVPSRRSDEERWKQAMSCSSSNEMPDQMASSFWQEAPVTTAIWRGAEQNRIKRI